MAIDTKRDELQALRIDRSKGNETGEPPAWARRYIIIGIAVVVLLSLTVLAYRLFSGDAPEVEVARATVESNNGGSAATVLSATGYIVAHHKIEANSKVTGRVAWIGVEKGDKVKEGQVLVRLEDQEFRAQYDQARGAAESARAVAQGVLSQQALDDATARYEASVQRVHSLEQSYQLSKLGPRAEQIARAKGAVTQAEGQAAYEKSQLDATVIRAPINGTILDRSVEKGELLTGQFASAARPVFSLANLNDLQVELDIAQDDFARLGPKQKGEVTVDAFPDRKYQGEIAEISPEANRQKATVQVKVQILNPDEYLRPEMNSTVKFLADQPKAQTASSGPVGVFVPSGAVRDHEGKKVVLIAFQGKVLQHEVRVKAQRSGGVLVEGLNGGEDVITAGPQTLKDRDKIKIKGQS